MQYRGARTLAKLVYSRSCSPLLIKLSYKQKIKSRQHFQAKLLILSFYSDLSYLFDETCSFKTSSFSNKKLSICFQRKLLSVANNQCRKKQRHRHAERDTHTYTHTQRDRELYDTVRNFIQTQISL